MLLFANSRGSLWTTQALILRWLSRCGHGCGAVVGIATHHFRSRTGQNRPLTRVLSSPIVTYMLTLDRDRQIVLSVDRFGQLAVAHISKLHFADLASSEPMYRALRRLVERKYLARIERRMVGGTGAGSGQYVYQLGSEGWKAVGKPGKYWPFRMVNYHTLAIADAHMELLELEREGRIEIVGFTTEPDTWLSIAGADLRPDMFVEVRKSFEKRTMSLWVETDMGTERQKAIKDKLARYWHAYENANAETLPVFPLVLFLAPDEKRARELRWWIESGPKDAQPLFIVSTVSEYARLLFG